MGEESDSSSSRSADIAFFDVETTVPRRGGEGFAILEFGGILVCPRKLVELASYSTLIRPLDLSRISSLSVRCNGITKDAVLSAPSFLDIAHLVYDFLNGRIWAGHNILRFDCARIREAFAEIKRPPPEPKGIIDSLALLTHKFGRRAGDMKMASLATYFGLGKQTHRSLDDVRMNLEVLKYCATVLFLESSLPDVLTDNSWVSPNAMKRSRSNGKSPVQQTLSPPHHIIVGNLPINEVMTPEVDKIKLPLTESNSAKADTYDLSVLAEGMEDPLPEDNMEEDKTGSTSLESVTSVIHEHSNGSNDFLEPENVSIPSISVTTAPFYRGLHRLQISHQNFPLQLQCVSLKVRFGISTKFLDHAGRPRLSFVVDAPPSLCKILDEIDSLAQKMSADSGSFSEWHTLVSRKPGFFKNPAVRLHLPTVVDGETTRWTTEMYQKDSSVTQKLVFSSSDVTELDLLFTPGNIIDAYFSVDAYDYQQNAGIRLVAKKVILHSS